MRVQKDTERRLIREQLAVKLRRKLKKLTPEQRGSFEAVAGESPEKTLERLLHEAPQQLSNWFSSKGGLAPILDWQSDGGNPRFMPISDHDDSSNT